MDYKGYADSWSYATPTMLPQKRLVAFGMHWHMEDGEHPYNLKINPAFFQRNPFLDTKMTEVPDQLQISTLGSIHGHNTMSDGNFSALCELDTEVPISPIFVKDLCGRTIHIGYGPEAKAMAEWDNYDYRDNPIYPMITFPKNCKEVDDSVEGHELIENVFLTKFRCLDMSTDYDVAPSGRPDDYLVGSYPNANLFPYKTRLDTFYTDGWRLPQTEMVYARQNVPEVQADTAADELMAKWSEHDKSKDYETFFDKNNGEEWFEYLFKRGCTVIPTLEACNGYNQVSRGYELIDYFDGRAVTGLHSIVSEIDGDSPRGTILAVVEPGYVTKSKVKPALVIVSNGSHYISPHLEDPIALVPNLFLPHQRSVADWGACWIPTHPLHFEVPATWGWDIQTGRFLQLTGPIWDPLHYYYDSVPRIVDLYSNPGNGFDSNKWLVEVPNEMKLRFYPVTVMQGFDVHDAEKRTQSILDGVNLITDSKFVGTEKIISSIGYHPMPQQYEYEMDTWWFPELDPRNRLKKQPDELTSDFIAPVIESALTPDDYIVEINAEEDQVWLADKSRLQKTSHNAISDYPFLLKYTELTAGENESEYSTIFLEHVDDDVLSRIGGATSTIDMSYDKIETIVRGMADYYYSFKDQAYKLRALRHKIYRDRYDLYSQASWQGQSLDYFVKSLEAEKQVIDEQKAQEQEDANVLGYDTNDDKEKSTVLDASIMGVSDL